jgi:hypothetical protein
MKTQITAFFIVLTLSFFACKKEKNPNNSIVGKWVSSESLSDIGNGKGKWEPVSDKSLYVDFKENGALESTVFPTYTHYTLIDSITVSLIKKDDTYQNYFYQIENEKLVMSPGDPVRCIEACGSKFVRAK